MQLKGKARYKHMYCRKPSEWYVSNNCVGGSNMYIAMRTRDTDKVKHSGNVQTYGGYSTNRKEVEEVVKNLNDGKIKPLDELAY